MTTKVGRVAIIDADLLGRKNHRFPNLACMKIAGYHKKLGDQVELLPYDGILHGYDRVYVSKVFTDTPDPTVHCQGAEIIRGGTGYFFDKAEPLPYEIEHHMPDYDLYGHLAPSSAEHNNASIGYAAPWKESEFRSVYSNVARWCNQFSMVKTMTFEEFCLRDGYPGTRRTLELLKNRFPKEYEEWCKTRFEWR